MNSVKQAAEHQKLFGDAMEDVRKWIVDKFNFQPSSSFEKISDSNFDDVIDAAYDFASKYSSSVCWDLIAEKDGIKVWKALRPLADKHDAEKWPCTKASAIVDAPPSLVADLLLDSSRVHEYNRFHWIFALI